MAMKRTGILIAVAAACLVMTAASESYAQSRFGAQNPSISRPRVNPYNNLLRGRGGYGGYGSSMYGLNDPLLSPYLRQNQSTASRRELNPAGNSTTNMVNPAVERARAARAGRTSAAGATGMAGSGVAPTGTGSSFMQYSHYYTLQNVRRR